MVMGVRGAAVMVAALVMVAVAVAVGAGGWGGVGRARGVNIGICPGGSMMDVMAREFVVGCLVPRDDQGFVK